MFSDFLSGEGMPIIFEAAQPHKAVVDKKTGLQRYVEKCDVDAVLDAIYKAVKGSHVYGIGVSEVHDGGHEKVPPLKYATWLKERAEKAKDIILYRSPVYYTKSRDEQEGYVEEVLREGIRNLIIAGGRSSSDSYPGYQPLEFLGRIKAAFGDKIFAGGVTIQTRKDEAQRLAEKTRHGMRYFRSQQIFDAEPVKRVLEGYWLQCQEQGLEPQMVFLSFVPILNERTIGKLRNLGVAIPEDVERTIYAGGSRGVSSASIAVAKRILLEIAEFVNGQGIKVPLGVDIESFFAGPVSVELAAELMRELEETAKGYTNPHLRASSRNSSYA